MLLRSVQNGTVPGLFQELLSILTKEPRLCPTEANSTAWEQQGEWRKSPSQKTTLQPTCSSYFCSISHPWWIWTFLGEFYFAHSQKKFIVGGYEALLKRSSNNGFPTTPSIDGRENVIRGNAYMPHGDLACIAEASTCTEIRLLPFFSLYQLTLHNVLWQGPCDERRISLYSKWSGNNGQVYSGPKTEGLHALER